MPKTASTDLSTDTLAAVAPERSHTGMLKTVFKNLSRDTLVAVAPERSHTGMPKMCFLKHCHGDI